MAGALCLLLVGCGGPRLEEYPRVEPAKRVTAPQTLTIDLHQDSDQLTLEIAKMVREDFLQQNAFMDVDSYSSHDRQMRMLALILDYEKLVRAAIEKGADLNAMLEIPGKEKIGRAKFVEADVYQKEYAAISEEVEREIAAIVEKAGADL